jgi:hypothetical protein
MTITEKKLDPFSNKFYYAIINYYYKIQVQNGLPIQQQKPYSFFLEHTITSYENRLNMKLGREKR